MKWFLQATPNLLSWANTKDGIKFTSQIIKSCQLFLAQQA